MRKTPLLFIAAPIAITLLLSGCESPATSMTQEQVSGLSNEQLCSLKSSYPWEQKTELEIGKRNLNCDPAYNECLGRGNQPNTPAMTTCIIQVRENWALQQEIQRKNTQIQNQQIQMNNQAVINSIRNSHSRAVITPNSTIYY